VKWTKDTIKGLLQNDDKAVLKGLLRIFSLQTATEQAVEYTKEHNGVGFSGYDAEFLTSLAKGYIQYGRLTEKQMIHLRKKILRYAGQLAKIANGEIDCPPLPAVRKRQRIVKPENIIVVPDPKYKYEERAAIQDESKPRKQLVW
jgi:hypothetical protein